MKVVVWKDERVYVKFGSEFVVGIQYVCEVSMFLCFDIDLEVKNLWEY